MSTDVGHKDGIMNVFSLYSSCLFVLNVEFGATTTSTATTSPSRKNGTAKPQRFCSPSVMKIMKERLMRAGVSRIGRYWMTPSLALEVDFSSALQLEKFVNNLEQGSLMKQLSDTPQSSDRSPSPSSVPNQMSLYFIRPSQDQEEVMMELVTADNVSRCVSIWRKRVRFNMGALLNWYKQTERSRVSGVATLPQLREELKTVRMWVWLGLCLQIPLADLQKIQQERGKEGARACLAAMLEKWTVEKEESPLWREVVAALCQIGHAFLATRIAKKYSTQLPVCKPEQCSNITTMKAKQQLEVMMKRKHHIQAIEDEITRITAEKRELNIKATVISRQLDGEKSRCKVLRAEKNELEEEMKELETEILVEQSSKLEQETQLSDKQLDLVMCEEDEEKHTALIGIAECSHLIEVIQTKIEKKRERVKSLAAAIVDIDKQLVKHSQYAELQTQHQELQKAATDLSNQLLKLRNKHILLSSDQAVSEEGMNLVLLSDEEDNEVPSDDSEERNSVTGTNKRSNQQARERDVPVNGSTSPVTSLSKSVTPPLVQIRTSTPQSSPIQPRKSPASPPARSRNSLLSPPPTPIPTSPQFRTERRGSSPVPYRARTLPRGRHHSASSCSKYALNNDVKLSRDDLIMDGAQEAAADPTKCTISSSSSIAQLDHDVTYTITLRDQYNRPCKHKQIVTAEAKSLSNGTASPAKVTHISYSQSKITFQPTTRGRHEITIRVNSRLIGKTPLELYVACPLSRVSKPRPHKKVNGMGRPWGVATDRDGRIIVTHPQLHKVSVFTSSWQQQFSIGSRLGEKHGQFDTPRGVATDYHGNIYIADSCNNRVQKFDKNGKFICSSSDQVKRGRVQLPTGIAVSDHNEVYVCDGHAHCVMVFSADLSLLRTLGCKGTREGQFHHPTGIAIDNSRSVVYVADQGNHRVCMLSQQGTFIRSFTCGKGGEVWFPTGVAVDILSSLVYITDCRHKCVQIFACDGTHIHSFGQAGNQSGEFNSIGGVAVNMDGFLLVCDDINNRIQLF